MPTKEEMINQAIERGNKERAKITREKTVTSFGWFNTYRDRYEMFDEILRTYQTYNVSGGSLHIYLEDGNNKVSDIKFCRNYALENKDWVGVYLCEELLYFGEEFIKLLIEENIHSAFAAWNNKQNEKIPTI